MKFFSPVGSIHILGKVFEVSQENMTQNILASESHVVKIS